jgi:hypothetical protein
MSLTLDQTGDPTAGPALERRPWSALIAAPSGGPSAVQKNTCGVALRLGPVWRVYTDEREGRTKEVCIWSRRGPQRNTT